MRMRQSILLIFVSIFLFSCHTQKSIIGNHTSSEEEYFEDEYLERFLDPIVISGDNMIDDNEPQIYRSTTTRTYDIVHTKLDLSFDWNYSHVMGEAELRLTPYFQPIDQLTLDAVGFDVHYVGLDGDHILKYDYNHSQLTIYLDKTYTRNDTFNILINYLAKPNENPISGSDAITSDKGLFFINPTGNDPNKPTQIWSQGESQNNSRWFPTFDRPNERYSQEVYLTVDDKYMTLSNGKLISSVKNSDGTRTDYWKQDLPHAPYLTMIAVGEFDVVDDTWEGIPLQYIVDKGYGPYAKNIFNHTPEMLTFFSEKFNYPYPWDKYSQIIVKDFVSGAMENTGAVVFGDFVQKTDRELIDNENDRIVAHEMMHHWFGNLVTCKDWSNLVLNEGFANYAEYLWFEHKYGKDKAELHRYDEMTGYFYNAYSKSNHPLVNYYYNNREAMFDAVTYNKGGLVLHILRKYVGDDAFFAALNLYLTRHEYTAVEIDKLRMAFEDVTGEDLHWFFDQWFMGVGHPVLNVHYSYNKENKVLLIEADQKDNPDFFTQTFILPIKIAVYYGDGSVSYHPFTMNETSQRFLIEDLKADPVSFSFDGENIYVAAIDEHLTEDQNIAKFLYSPHLIDRIYALNEMETLPNEVIAKGLSDSSPFIRENIIDRTSDESAIRSYRERFKSMALSDPHSGVRSSALARYVSSDDQASIDLCKIVLENEKAYPVLGIAIEHLLTDDIKNKPTYLNFIKSENADYLLPIYITAIDEPTSDDLDYIESKARTINQDYLMEFFENYQDMLLGKNIHILDRSVDNFAEIAGTKDGNTWRKLLSMTSLLKIAEDLNGRLEADNTDEESKELLMKTSFMIINIASEETDPLLQEYYENIR